MKLRARSSALNVRPWLLAAVLTGGLALCGCGSSQGSSGSATGPSSRAAPSSSAASSAPGAPASSSTAAPTSTAGASAGAASSSSAASSAARQPDTNVRLPASFTIRAGGALDPPVIAAPRHTDIALTVASGDRRGHAFALLTPHAYRTMVLPSGPAHVLLKGLPDGTYAVEVDRVRRGRMIIGAAPGP